MTKCPAAVVLDVAVVAVAAAAAAAAVVVVVVVVVGGGGGGGGGGGWWLQLLVKVLQPASGTRACPGRLQVKASSAASIGHWNQPLHSTFRS